jgi:hypothetical protein
MTDFAIFQIDSLIALLCSFPSRSFSDNLQFFRSDFFIACLCPKGLRPAIKKKLPMLQQEYG